MGMKVEEPAGMLVVNGANPNNWIQVIENDLKEHGRPTIIISLISSRDKESKVLYPTLKVYKE